MLEKEIILTNSFFFFFLIIFHFYNLLWCLASETIPTALTWDNHSKIEHLPQTLYFFGCLENSFTFFMIFHFFVEMKDSIVFDFFHKKNLKEENGRIILF